MSSLATTASATSGTTATQTPINDYLKGVYTKALDEQLAKMETTASDSKDAVGPPAPGALGDAQNIKEIRDPLGRVIPGYFNKDGSYSFGSVGGSLVNQATEGLTEIGNKYKDNETVGGAVAGSFLDIYRTSANTGLALQYNKSFLGDMADYQQRLESLKTSNTEKLMGAEGAAARELMEARTREDIKLRNDARGSISRTSAKFYG